MSVNILCDDLLIEIFNYLPIKTKINCELVCKRWRSILNRYCQPRSLRFELLIYKRSNYRVICKLPDHQFTDLNTIKFKNVNDIHKINQILMKYGNRVTSLCFGFSFFNQFQYLIERTGCLKTMIEHMDNLEHFQCKSFGDGITVDLFEECKHLLMKLTHFSFDYKEEDITKISMQPWIEILLKYGTKLESVYIKFQRMGIKFPFNLPLPENLRFLYLPSCDLTREEFYHLLDNGGYKLEELSVHSISSNFLQKLLDRMPLLKRLNTRIRVDQNDNGIGLQKLKLFKKMELFTLNQFISPADTHNPVFSTNYGYWTIIDVLSNSPETKHLRLKSLPLIRRFEYLNEDELNDEDLNDDDDLNDDLSDIEDQDFNNNNHLNNEPNQDLAINEERPFQINNLEFNFINRQFKLLETIQSNWCSIEQITIKLNEKKTDYYLNEALNRLILCLSEFRNLKILQIEQISDKAQINSFNILKLIECCDQLSQLHIGLGAQITPEIVDAFLKRAIQNPQINYELKFKNTVSYEIVCPCNLMIF